MLFSDPIANAHHNDVFMNEAGIALFFVAGTAEVSYNSSRNNLGDGIPAYDSTSGNLISHNKAFQNAGIDCVDDTIQTLNTG